MSYIWSDYSNKRRYSLCTEHLVSGVEVWKGNEADTKVNVLIRLKNLVFPPKLVQNEKNYSKLIEKYTNDAGYRDIFNFIMHMQAVSDLSSGAAYSDILSVITEREILNGDYGEEVKEDYFRCGEKEKYLLLQCRSEYLISDCRKNMFESFIEKVFREVNIYYQQSTAKTYIYIHTDKNEENLAALRLGSYFLADIGREVEIMWKGQHLPFIGTDWSMVLGSIYLG